MWRQGRQPSGASRHPAPAAGAGATPQTLPGEPPFCVRLYLYAGSLATVVLNLPRSSLFFVRPIVRLLPAASQTDIKLSDFFLRMAMPFFKHSRRCLILKALFRAGSRSQPSHVVHGFRCSGRHCHAMVHAVLMKFCMRRPQSRRLGRSAAWVEQLSSTVATVTHRRSWRSAVRRRGSASCTARWRCRPPWICRRSPTAPRCCRCRRGRRPRRRAPQQVPLSRWRGCRAPPRTLRIPPDRSIRASCPRPRSTPRKHRLGGALLWGFGAAVQGTCHCR